MVMNYLQTYKEIKEKDMVFEQGIINDGIIKIHKENNEERWHSNDKPQYWKKKKNIVIGGVIDTQYVHRVGATPTHQTLIINRHSNKNHNYNQMHAIEKILTTSTKSISTQHTNTHLLRTNKSNQCYHYWSWIKPKVQKPPSIYTPLG